MISIFLLIFSFCSYIICLISLNCLSVVSYNSLHLLKITISNSLVCKSHISILGGWLLLENYCIHLVVSFPWFFMLLELLYYCFFIWSSHLLQSLLVNSGEKYIQSALLGNLKFCEHSSMICLLHTCCSLWRGNSKDSVPSLHPEKPGYVLTAFYFL